MKEIKYVKGDATRPEGLGTRVIVHCCNNIGKWGSGFVMALSARWAEPEAEYLTWFNPVLRGRKQAPVLGDIQVVLVDSDTVTSTYVVNLIGQHGIRSRAQPCALPPIRYDAIRQGLRQVALLPKDKHNRFRNMSVHMPRMGCDRAGGKWSVVEAIIKEELSTLDIPVTVYDLK